MRGVGADGFGNTRRALRRDICVIHDADRTVTLGRGSIDAGSEGLSARSDVGVVDNGNRTVAVVGQSVDAGLWIDRAAVLDDDRAVTPPRDG